RDRDGPRRIPGAAKYRLNLQTASPEPSAAPRAPGRIKHLRPKFPGLANRETFRANRETFRVEQGNLAPEKEVGIAVGAAYRFPEAAAAKDRRSLRPPLLLTDTLFP